MLRTFVTSGMAGILLIGGVGCSELPGTPGQQGAAIGGVSGAAAGAAIGGSEHRLLGALLGGAIGAGGGYLIGANKDRITGKDSAAAQEAMHRAQTTPATAPQVQSASTADVNNDGFVTMDEIVAMRQAGLSDQQMVERLRATGQVFELTPEQQTYLRNQGVSDYVLRQLPELNRDVRDSLMGQQTAPSSTAPIVGRRPGT